MILLDERSKKKAMDRIGFGSDLHKLAEGYPLIIGGIEIESPIGAVGHSDADVLLHAVTDAILGAIAAGDIGSHFPDTDDQWKGADSAVFLAEANRAMADQGYRIANIDSVIHLERPKLRGHIEAMRENVASILELNASQVSVKAKTGEGLDSIGESRSIKAEAFVLLKRN